MTYLSFTYHSFQHDIPNSLEFTPLLNKLYAPLGDVGKWNVFLFKNILKNQPELKDDYEKLKKHIEGKNKNELEFFQNLFTDKIDINSVKDIVFKSYYRDKNESMRKINYCKDLHKNHPEFLSIIDKEIKTNNNSIVFESYFSIMRAKDTDKSMYTNEHILENIKKYETYAHLASAKKKINAYLSLFDATPVLYEFIMNDLQDIFKNNPAIANYWEEKLKKFPQAQQKEYLKSKPEEIQMVETQDSYMYTFKINPKWLIVKHKISDKGAKDLIEEFNDCFYSLLNKKLEVDYANSKGQKIDFVAKTPEKIEEVKNYCDFIAKEFPNIVSNFDFKFKGYERHQKMKETLEKLDEYFSLTKKVENKPQTNKVKNKL